MTVGIVPGGVDDPTPIVETVTDADRSVAVGRPTEVVERDPDVVVACDETALLGLVRAGVRAPILPIAAGAGLQSVPADAARTAVASVLDGDATTVEYPLLGISADGERLASALFDVSLMTTEPAHISEYELSSNGTRVARFRADGVVVTTPAGSHGYAKAAGGSLIEPGTSVVGVVPVAPFVTHELHWILDASDVAVSIARDESAVTLYADDSEVTPVSPSQRIELATDDAISILTVPESTSRFGD